MAATSDQATMWRRFQPDAEALYDLATGRRFTWAQLDDASRSRAAWLASQGVGRGDVVAVLAENHAETFVALFACAHLGAILFPVNWRLSPAEITWQLDDSRAKVLLVDPPNAGRVAAPQHDLLTDPPDAPFRGPGARLEDPWVLMYTSGSSGKPKGALLTHQQIHWNAVTTVLACELRLGDSTLTFAPLFHTGGLNCLSTPLLERGGRVVITNKVDPAEILRCISSERITHLMGVPTIYQMIADHPDFAAADLSSVRDAICGGSALPLPLLLRYQERHIPLRQGFGLTEVGPNCFSTPPADVIRKLGSVGKPIHHIEARITRADGTEADADEPGELWLRGPLVFGGYWNRPDANAEAFVDGWFRTGDVLSRDAEDFFWVRGRIKEMYKSGGENVYPAEVEAVIAQIPGVAVVAVIGLPDARWGEVGRAFVQPQPGATLTEAGILEALQGQLARFKQPKSVIVLPELPRIGSGKVDKQSLKSWSP